MYYLKHYYGTIIVTQDYFSYFSFGLKNNGEGFKANGPDFKGHCRRLIYRWHEIEEILVKPFFGPTVGFEIYMCDKKSFTFNMLTIDAFKRFIARLKSIKNFKQTRKLEFNLVDDPVEAFKSCGFAESWKLGEKSNQEFLLLLNKYAGRTFNFWQQYPFFPHVLVDFNSSLIEFNDDKTLNKVYRDFKRPSTCMSDEKEIWMAEATEDRNNLICMGQDSGYQLQHSHGYMDALRVGNLMQRLEPFTSLYLELNGVPENSDRIHASNSWIIDAVNANNLNFCCELNPEFYYLPELFTNENFIHVSINTSNENVD